LNCLNCNRLGNGLEAGGLHVAPIKYYYIYVFELLDACSITQLPIALQRCKNISTNQKEYAEGPLALCAMGQTIWDIPGMVFVSGKMGYPSPLLLREYQIYGKSQTNVDRGQYSRPRRPGNSLPLRLIINEKLFNLIGRHQG
jgi:hypothetical protein